MGSMSTNTRFPNSRSIGIRVSRLAICALIAIHQFAVAIALSVATPANATMPSQPGSAKAAPTSDGAITKRSRITGRIKLQRDCHRKPEREGQAAGRLMLWVATELPPNLIQQIELPADASFSVDVVPGTYVISANNELGCAARQSVSVREGQEHQLTLDVERWKRKPASSELAALTCACIQAPCNCGSMFPSRPSYVMPTWNPWWMYYGGMYPNFYYPGMWTGWGLQPQWYPGYGPIAAAKPNVYIEAPGGLDLELRVSFPKQDPMATWLATSPADKNGTWKIKSEADGVMWSDGARHTYIFYDMRGSDRGLQREAGFCRDRNDALNEMQRLLKARGFKSHEVADFSEHWQIKLPPGELCVFPQAETEFATLADLKLEVLENSATASKAAKTPPIEYTRQLFVVVPKKSIDDRRAGAFTDLPEQAWIPPRAPASVAGPRSARSAKIHVREWGVAFTFDFATSSDPKSRAP